MPTTDQRFMTDKAAADALLKAGLLDEAINAYGYALDLAIDKRELGAILCNRSMALLKAGNSAEAAADAARAREDLGRRAAPPRARARLRALRDVP